MKRKGSKRAEFFPSDPLIMVVGNYGSGKTEVAVNLAIRLAGQGLEPSIADLDIVNPYFRCREARVLMERYGIRVVVPPASQTWADLPIVLPEIKGMLDPSGKQLSLFDVGGDDVGAKLLSSLVEALGSKPYQLWQVINARRPFTETVQGCLDMRDRIESASRLKVTGLVVNTHLMAETTPEVILDGYHLARKVAKKSGIPIICVTAMDNLAEDPALDAIEAPLMRLERYMLPPWLRPKSTAAEKDDGAGNVRPIGLP